MPQCPRQVWSLSVAPSVDSLESLLKRYWIHVHATIVAVRIIIILMHIGRIMS